MNRFSVVIAVAISAGSIVPTACASTWISNLDQPLRPVGCGFVESSVVGSSWCANFFTTDGAPYILDGATLRVAAQNRPLHVQVLLFDDTDGVPGARIHSMRIVSGSGPSGPCSSPLTVARTALATPAWT